MVLTLRPKSDRVMNVGSVRVSVQKAKVVDEDGNRVLSPGRGQSTEKENTMADEPKIGLQELLRKAMTDRDAV